MTKSAGGQVALADNLLFRSESFGAIGYDRENFRSFYISRGAYRLLDYMNERGQVGIQELQEAFGLNPRSITSLEETGVLTSTESNHFSTNHKLKSLRPRRADILSGPTYFKLYPTMKCNANCDFCYVGSDLTKHSPYGDMTKDDIDSLIRTSERCGLFRIAILGGEPFLFRHLDYLLEECVKHNLYTTIATNGSVFRESVLRFTVGSNMVKLGLSIESHIPHLHDEIVHLPGAHSHLMEMIRYLTEKKYPVLAETVVYAKNKKSINEFVSFLAKLGVTRVALIYPHRTGNIMNFAREPLQEYVELCRGAMRLGKEIGIDVVPDTHYLFMFPEIEPTLITPLTRYIKGCASRKTKLEVLPNGDLYPCSFFFNDKRFRLGNIFEDDIEDIWNEDPVLEKFREITLAPTCQSCSFASTCYGGCLGARYAEYGSIDLQETCLVPDPNCPFPKA